MPIVTPRRLFPLFVIFATASCGSDSGSATTPTSVTTAPSITTSINHIFIGQSVPFVATGSGVRWGGDAPTIASVDAFGVVSGLKNGEVTVWAENAGGRDSRRLRVLPNFAGTWSGSYVITECRASDQMQSQMRFCETARVGQTVTMAAVFTQDHDIVHNVSIRLGDLERSSDPVGWGVTSEGFIHFIGPIEAIRNGLKVMIHIVDGRLESVTPESLNSGHRRN